MVLSGLLEICKRVSVKKSECVLCHVDRSVLVENRTRPEQSKYSCTWLIWNSFCYSSFRSQFLGFLLLGVSFFPLLDEYLFVLTQIFELTEVFIPFSNPAKSFLCQQKSINTASRPLTILSFEGDSIPKPQLGWSSLIVSTSRHKNPIKKRILA